MEIRLIGSYAVDFQIIDDEAQLNSLISKTRSNEKPTRT